MTELELENQEREEEEEYIRNQARWSRVAKRVLNDSDIMELFDIVMDEHQIAFRNLPLDASVEEYKTVHYGFLAIGQLISRLSNFIIKNELSEQQRDQDVAMKEVNI